MKANELRIGNLVKWGVHSLPVLSIMETNAHGDSSKPYVRLPHPTGIQYLSDIEPIPLTEEWLLKLGMVQSAMKTWWYKFEEQFEIEFYEDEFWLNGYDGTMQPIKYVHLLQNIYYSLTGEELTIKENATEP